MCVRVRGRGVWECAWCAVCELLALMRAINSGRYVYKITIKRINLRDINRNLIKVCIELYSNQPYYGT